MEDKNLTPYAQMLAVQMRPEAQATFAYEYQRYAKDPTLAFVLTCVLGLVGGESYYLGNYIRGILMTLALFSGIGLFVTVPMWICRCFTIQNECEAYNDCVAFSLALRYWPREAHSDEQPPAPPQGPQPVRARANIGGLPMAMRGR
jgi:hypothetical protein